ncbi:MAG: NHL repeat-containing protein [Saprospiraceae bacterium]|nr:NHL repeat-containing protein [Saprospiraceae bacterium]
MRYLETFSVLALLIMWSSCGEKETLPPQWERTHTLQLGDFRPIGVAYMDSILWISDGDNNRLGMFSLEGELLDLQDGFDRPMHIAAYDGQIFVPEYGSDSIRMVEAAGVSGSYAVADSLDAPAGVDAGSGALAIADFYNHRIVYQHDGEWQSFGREGNAPGEFYYPTDVQLEDGMIYVADAYNNRVQVLDHEGNAVLIFGKEHNMNGATGIYVDGDYIFVTDFENDRLMVFDRDGLLQQIIEEVAKPTDAIVIDEKLFVASYADRKVDVFVLGKS